jgi:integrase
VDFNQGTISIKHTVTRITKSDNEKDTTKTKSSYRMLPLSYEITQQLKKVKQQQDALRRLQPNDYKSDGYIFTRSDGSRIETSYPSHHFKRLIKKHVLPVIRFHDLRHSAGTYLMYLGFSVKEIQEWLGHADINTTLKYLHFDMAGKRKMLDKINQGLKRNAN